MDFDTDFFRFNFVEIFDSTLVNIAYFFAKRIQKLHQLVRLHIMFLSVIMTVGSGKYLFKVLIK